MLPEPPDISDLSFLIPHASANAVSEDPAQMSQRHGDRPMRSRPVRFRALDVPATSALRWDKGSRPFPVPLSMSRRRRRNGFIRSCSFLSFLSS